MNASKTSIAGSYVFGYDEAKRYGLFEISEEDIAGYCSCEFNKGLTPRMPTRNGLVLLLQYTLLSVEEGKATSANGDEPIGEEGVLAVDSNE
jgi:hypothetical protein